VLGEPGHQVRPVVGLHELALEAVLAAVRFVAMTTTLRRSESMGKPLALVGGHELLDGGEHHAARRNLE